jgi:hypothetical protein
MEEDDDRRSEVVGDVYVNVLTYYMKQSPS